MKKYMILYYLVIIVLLSATDSAFASEDNILSLDKTLIIQLVIFVSAIFMLNKLLFKPLLELDSRRQKLTTGTISEAKELKIKAEETIMKYKEQMNIARAQVQEERNEIRKHAHASASEMITRARGVVNGLLDEARANIEMESQELRDKVRPEVKIIAKDIASRLMNKEI